MSNSEQEIHELKEQKSTPISEEYQKQESIQLEEKKSEVDIEELIRKQPVIPEISFRISGPKASKRARAKKDVCFCHEDLFDSENIHNLLQKDYQHFLKVKRFNSVLHFNHNQEPFSYMYEREGWDLRLFDKFQYLIREFCNPLKSGPFSHDGRCVFFEFETLYKPTKCVVYVNKSYGIVKSNINRFNKVSAVFNRDTYEDILVNNMDIDDHPFDLPNLSLKGTSKVVHAEYDPDSFIELDADRNKLPRTFFGESEEDKQENLNEEKVENTLS